MKLPRWQPNNVVKTALAHLPIDDCGLSKLASVEKNVDRHNEHKVPHGDVHSTVPNVVIWRFFNERRQTRPHTPTPPRSNTEQRSNRSPSVRFGNCEIGNDVRCSTNDRVNPPEAA